MTWGVKWGYYHLRKHPYENHKLRTKTHGSQPSIFVDSPRAQGRETQRMRQLGKLGKCYRNGFKHGVILEYFGYVLKHVPRKGTILQGKFHRLQLYQHRPTIPFPERISLEKPTFSAFMFKRGADLPCSSKWSEMGQLVV